MWKSRCNLLRRDKRVLNLIYPFFVFEIEKYETRAMGKGRLSEILERINKELHGQSGSSVSLDSLTYLNLRFIGNFKQSSLNSVRMR